MKFLSHKKKHIIVLLTILFLIIITAKLTNNFTFIKSTNLMNGISAKKVSAKTSDDMFIRSTADFSIELFKKSINDEKNSLISPLSVMLSLSMTANGADKETLSQMEKVMGKDISIDELNEYLHTYVNSLPNAFKTKLNIANSIWYNDHDNHMKVDDTFLQINKNYYNPSIYKSDFNQQTVDDINHWVSKKTDGKIKNIVDKIDSDTKMLLINAVAFDAKWEEKYENKNISKDIFHTIDGEQQNAYFMYSIEDTYLNDGNATGFIKPYYGDRYEFVALLPNMDQTIGEYIQSLTGEELLKTIKNAEFKRVGVYLPKFEYDYTIHMNTALVNLGMTDAFSEKADFSRMSNLDLYIYDVLHSSYISVDDNGTKASAATKVEMREKSADMPPDENVKLDRPFVYAIIDSKTKLPIFIGTMMNID